MKEVNAQFANKQIVKNAGRTFVGSTALLAAAASHAAIDIAAPLASMQSDGIAGITAVGFALITLAGVAVVFKWVKAAFF